MNVLCCYRVRIIIVTVGAGVIFSVGVADDDVTLESLQKIVTVDRYAVTISLSSRTAGDFLLPVNILASDKPLFAEEPCDLGR